MNARKQKFSIRKLIRRAVNLAPKKTRNKIIRHMMKVEMVSPPELTICLAQSKEELEAALSILHDSYVSEGLMKPDPSGMRISPYHALPSTSTFVAKWNGEVVGTLSVIRDSIFGFPSDKIFDVSELRQKGLKIAEPSALAIRSDFRGKNNAAILFALFKYLVEYSIKQFGIDYWIIAVNPKHVELYEAVLCFKRYEAKPVAHYDYVNGAPAHGFICDLSTWEIELAIAYANKPANENLYLYFFKTPCKSLIYPDRKFSKISDPFMTPDLLDYFFNKKSDTFKNLTPEQRSNLHVLYNSRAYESILPKTDSVHPGRARNAKRFEVNCAAILLLEDGKSIDMKVSQVSRTGFKGLCNSSLTLGETLKAKIAIGDFEIAVVEIESVWNKQNESYGFSILNASDNWQSFIQYLDCDFSKMAA